MSRFLDFLDRISFLNINIWDFSSRSLFKEYGRLFLFKVVIPHPVRTLRGLYRYRKILKMNKTVPLSHSQAFFLPCTHPLVGFGFCLKPHDPDRAFSSCPSGRANHDCLFLEGGQTRPICSQCLIHKIAVKCLESGCRVYIMTSAQDIARDFLIPQVQAGTFPTAILLLCPYSIRAIQLPLLICGIDMFLMAYDRGDCRDYTEWRKADLGEKEEITGLSPSSWAKLMTVLAEIGPSERKHRIFRREGNVFYPD